MSNIVFISELPTNEQQSWLSQLNQKLCDNKIKLPHQLSDEEAFNVDIAIVANPNPDDIAKYPNLVWIQSLWAGVEKILQNGLPESVKLVRLIDPSLSTTMAESEMSLNAFRSIRLLLTPLNASRPTPPRCSNTLF